MKSKFLLISLLLMMLACKQKLNDKQLTIYTYDSLGWLNQEIVSNFTKAHDCEIIIDANFTDTGDMLAKAILEKSKPKADILMGITPSLLGQAKKHKIFQQYHSPLLNTITNQDLVFDQDFFVTPFDYGPLAILYDPAKTPKPERFSDLWLAPKQLIIQDPRTSSTGLDFFLWTMALYPDNWQETWKSLLHGVRTISPGWTESFMSFETGEANMMISYATDPAYAVHNYGSSKYLAYIPEEGGFLQIEGAGIINGTSRTELAQAFIDYLLTEDFQQHIALNQWMLPVIPLALPDSFEHIATTEHFLTLPSSVYERIPEYLEIWENIIY